MTLPKRPRDPAQLAKLMIDIASGEVAEDQPTAKETRARKGGTKGGPARAKALSPEQRSEEPTTGHWSKMLFAAGTVCDRFFAFRASGHYRRALAVSIASFRL
jgi:hypothetical protein